MSNIPMFYEYQNAVQSLSSPIPQYKLNDMTTYYFGRYIMQKILSNFELENMPEEWQRNYVMYSLFCNGYFIILDTPNFGTIPQVCSLTGYNIFWGPRAALVSNKLLPELSGKELLLGRDCELIQLSPDYCGIVDLVMKYATEYALATQAFDVALTNSKLAYIFAAGNNKIAEAFKKMVDQVQQGNPAVFIDSALLNPDSKPNWEAIFRDQKGSTIINELLNALEKLDARLNTDIGIPNVNISKASGVSADEVNANNIDTCAKASLWLDTINEGLAKANKRYNLNLKMRLRFNPEGVNEDADTREADNDWPV